MAITIPQEYITTNLNLETEMLVPGEPPEQFCIKTEREQLKLMGYAQARNAVDATVDSKVSQAAAAAGHAASSASAASTAKTQAQAAASIATQKAQIATDAAATVAQAGQYVETAMQAATTAQSASAQAAKANETALANSQIVLQAAQTTKGYRDESQAILDEVRDLSGGSTIGGLFNKLVASKIIVSALDTSKAYTKNDLLANWLATEDASNVPDESAWIRFNDVESYFYVDDDRVCLLRLLQCYRINPGYSESPPYSSDMSSTALQFCISNSQSTSADIDARIAEMGMSLPWYGGWNSNSITAKAPIVTVAGKHPYRRLYVRFKNVKANNNVTNYVPQSVKHYGGDSSFRLHSLEVYPQMLFSDL